MSIETMEIFTTSYMTYFCFAPYFLALLVLLCRAGGSMVAGSVNDGITLIIMGILLMGAFSPISDICKETGFIEDRMEQMDGVETYAEQLENSGDKW